MRKRWMVRGKKSVEYTTVVDRRDRLNAMIKLLEVEGYVVRFEELRKK